MITRYDKAIQNFKKKIADKTEQSSNLEKALQEANKEMNETRMMSQMYEEENKQLK